VMGGRCRSSVTTPLARRRAAGHQKIRFCSRPMPRTAPPAPASTPGLNGARAGLEHGCSRCSRAARADRAGRQSSSSRQRCSGRQPAGSSLAGLGSRFGSRLQPAGAAKALGVGRGRGDEQGGRGAARAARWRLREARRAPRVAGCLPVLRPLCLPS
jgi:hypothetical protein